MMADGQPQRYRHGTQRHTTGNTQHHRPPPPPLPSDCSTPTISRPPSGGNLCLSTGRSRPAAPSPQEFDSNEPLYDASRQDREEGYDYEFVPPADSKYECPICLLVLRGTEQTTCGHRFCTACIHRWLRDTGGPKCPVCNEPISENALFPDRFADREIMLFPMRCPNNKYGCATMLELKHLSDHLSQVCDYVLVPCPNHCTNVLYKKDIDWHCAKECVKRETPCDLCGQKIPTHEKDVHKEVCLEQKLNCVYCKTVVQRKYMQQHIENCDMVPIACLFKPLGCFTELTRSGVSSHNQAHTQFHMGLTARALNRLLQELNITCQFSQQTTNNRYPLVSQQGTANTGIVLGPDKKTATTETDIFSEPDFVQQRQRVASEGECISGHGTEAENVTQNLSTTPLCTNNTTVSFLSGQQTDPRLQSSSVNASLLDSATGTRQPSYVNLPLSDPGRLKVNVGQGESGNLGGKTAALRQQISCEESLRFAAEGGVDFLEKSRQHEASVAKQKQLILELQAKVAHLEKRLGENLQSVNVQKEKIQKQEEMIASFEGRNCNGVYIWKIREFTRLRQEALRGQTTVLHSPGFYTRFHGYKLCIRANLNGVEGGNGSHISIFIHFMRGEFDDILDWPFRGKIILTVIDQGEHKQHITEILESKPTLAAFQRPLTNRNHKGFGYIEFAPVALIEQSTYVTNDTLILKAEVSEL